MTDFKCIVNPYHVYALGSDWDGDQLTPPLDARLQKTLTVARELSASLSGRRYTSTWEV